MISNWNIPSSLDAAAFTFSNNARAAKGPTTPEWGRIPESGTAGSDEEAPLSV